MPYIHTVIDTPLEKIYVPFPGMGDDSAFRFVRMHLDEGGSRRITISSIAGAETTIDPVIATWLVGAIRDIPGMGIAHTPPICSRGQGCELRVDGTIYSIDIDGYTPITMTGRGLFMLHEALTLCLAAPNARSRAG